MHDLSESSASNNSEEEIETNQLIIWPSTIVGEQSYVSALSFSKSSAVNISAKSYCQHAKPYSESHEICDKKDVIEQLVNSSHERMLSSHTSNFFDPGKSNCLFEVNTQSNFLDPGKDGSWPVVHLSKASFDDNQIDEKMVSEKHMGLQRNATLYNGNIIAIGDALGRESLGENLYDNGMLSLNLYSFQLQNNDHRCGSPSMNPLSVNPMLTRNSLLCMMGRNGEKYITDHQEPLPYFNFSTVDDPCKVYMDKLLIGSQCGSGSANGNKNCHYREKHHSGKDGLNDETKNCVMASLDFEGHNSDVLADVSGGSSWERLLGSYRNAVDSDATHKICFSTFEIPLDIIIDKCLLQEIILQYP